MSTRKRTVKKPHIREPITRGARDYLLPNEVGRLLKAALNDGRHANRNHTLILLCYRHALRVQELTQLRWTMVDFKHKVLRVKRMRNGLDSVHPLSITELRALRKLKEDYPGSSFVFVTDRGTKLGSRTISRIVAEAAQRARLKFRVSPTMLRRGCGHALAKAGHSIIVLRHFLGHRDIRHTLRYFELPKRPFKDFWKS